MFLRFFCSFRNDHFNLALGTLYYYARNTSSLNIYNLFLTDFAGVHKWNVTVITEIVLVHLLNMNPCPLFPLSLHDFQLGFCSLLWCKFQVKEGGSPTRGPFSWNNSGKWCVCVCVLFRCLYNLDNSFWKIKFLNQTVTFLTLFYVCNSFASKPPNRKPWSWNISSLEDDGFIFWSYFTFIQEKLFKIQLLIRVFILSSSRIDQTN